MTPYPELISIEKTSETPIYLQIMNAFIYNIRIGQFRRGVKLPGSRELAAMLNVHRNTLQNAYEELAAQGWIKIIPRKGVFVVDELPEIKPAKISTALKINRNPEKTIFPIDEKSILFTPLENQQHSKNLIIDDGFPDIREAPIELLIREFRRLSRINAFKKYFRYGSPQGYTPLLEVLSEFLSDTRGFVISPDNIMITRGAQMGIYLTAELLIKPGDNVIVGEPGFFAATLTLKQAGANINTAPVDDLGIDVDAVERLCKRKKIKLVYVIPHHHHPTTVTLTPERRIRLLDLAAKYKFAIIEDDYDYDFHYNKGPVLPMASIDHNGSIIYIGTLSKTLVPAIRLGFIVAPQNFIKAVSLLRRSIDWQGDSMMEAAIAELYKNGTISRHIKKVVKLYHERRDNFCMLLKEKLGGHVSFKIPDGGMSVWTKFNDVDLKMVSAKAEKYGLSVDNGVLHNTAGKNYNATRLGFASLDFKEQEKAVGILKQVIEI